VVADAEVRVALDGVAREGTELRPAVEVTRPARHDGRHRVASFGSVGSRERIAQRMESAAASPRVAREIPDMPLPSSSIMSRLNAARNPISVNQ